MPSKFAIELSNKLTADIPEHIVKWGQGVIDKELAEVREVIRDLLGFAETEGDDQSEMCQRARAIYEKLKV